MMIWHSLSLRDQINFTYRLHAILQAGVPLLEGLHLLEQCCPKHWKSFLSHTIQGLKRGNSLATSLSKEGKWFSPICIGLISIGEKTGALEQSLFLIHQQLLAKESLIQQMKRALTYPAITFTAALLMVTTMLLWVIPSFEDIFAHFHAELPISTQLLITLSRGLSEHVAVILGSILIVVAGILLLWRTSIGFQKWCDRHCFRIPIFGEFMRLSHQITWCQNIAHLLQSGLSLLESIRICAQSSNHWLSHDLSAKLFKQLSLGWDLGAAMKRTDPNGRFFDPETIQLL
ncbi:MAG: type II secretion system F family protein, partial [Burkholderiaceae bacterium]|nr:type II secretion system F family protein [Burkholderiaceae bacterium]